MVFFHFSEEPDIARFEPRPPAAAQDRDLPPVVWAIDEEHAAIYFFPRDCPRACFWPGDGTTASDRERFFVGVAALMVIAVEADWLDRIRATVLYCYELPSETFRQNDATAGHYISREPVTPLRVEPVGDLLAAVTAAGVELRITPSLVELWRRVIASTMEFSGTRLRNAHDWHKWEA